jgi:hypothetical protein
LIFCITVGPKIVPAETIITKTQSKIKSPKKRKKNSQVDEFKLTNRLYNKGINLEIINNMSNVERESILMKLSLKEDFARNTFRFLFSEKKSDLHTKTHICQ